ncbi:WAP four-disulfide core domain 3, partial [Chelydra serpentina]
ALGKDPAPGSTMKSGAIVLLGLLALWAQLPPASAQVRPGACPKPQGLGLCVERCRGDYSCPPGQKCCSNGCGHVCMKAIIQPRVRPGACPKPQGLGLCVERCRGDYSCPPGRKCCGNGCGHVCKKAIIRLRVHPEPAPSPRPGDLCGGMQWRHSCPPDKSAAVTGVATSGQEANPLRG